jgi:hypothetical protein
MATKPVNQVPPLIVLISCAARDGYVGGGSRHLQKLYVM